jgi:hypothetical protein
VVNTDISAVIPSTEVFVSTTQTAGPNYSPKIDGVVCATDTVMTFKFLITLTQMTMNLGVGNQNYFFTKDFTVNCICHYPERVSVPDSSLFTLYYRVYITQVESNEYYFPRYGWSACKRSFCPYNSTCIWPECNAQCKPFSNTMDIVNEDMITPFKDIDPTVFDESNINEGMIKVQKMKIGYYRIHFRKQTTEDTALTTDIGSGVIPV